MNQHNYSNHHHNRLHPQQTTLRFLGFPFEYLHSRACNLIPLNPRVASNDRWHNGSEGSSTLKRVFFRTYQEMAIDVEIILFR